MITLLKDFIKSLENGLNRLAKIETIKNLIAIWALLSSIWFIRYFRKSLGLIYKLTAFTSSFLLIGLTDFNINNLLSMISFIPTLLYNTGKAIYDNIIETISSNPKINISPNKIPSNQTIIRDIISEKASQNPSIFSLREWYKGKEVESDSSSYKYYIYGILCISLVGLGYYYGPDAYNWLLGIINDINNSRPGGGSGAAAATTIPSETASTGSITPSGSSTPVPTSKYFSLSHGLFGSLTDTEKAMAEKNFEKSLEGVTSLGSKPADSMAAMFKGKLKS